MEQKHSGLGIASFALSLLMGLIILGLVITAGVMEVTTPGGVDEESPQAVVLGCFLIIAMLADLAALGLGIGGLIQKDRKKIFAILGTVFSGLTLLGTLGLMVAGTAMQ